MRRRSFLRYGLQAAALPAVIRGFSVKSIETSSWFPLLNRQEESDRVFVLVQLSGGNDGLNTVIPLEFYRDYQQLRGNIAIPENKILKLNGYESTGLHPAMPDMQRLFQNQELAIIQAVSYPQPNFSHFRATDIWLTGSSSDQVLPTGWAGRYLNEEYPGFPTAFPNNQMPDPLAIQVGSIVSPLLQGPTFSMGMAITNPSNFYNLLDNEKSASASSRSGDQIAFIQQMAVKTDQYSDVIRKAAQKISKQSNLYPAAGKNELADQLKIVARLIAGGLKTKIYVVGMGGFDTHARQTDMTDTSTGVHAKQLGKLSEAIGAFMDDLSFLKIQDRVMGMTFSEFGRRIKSNASGGTDHGAAAPVFLFGQHLQAGILGKNPSLNNDSGKNENVLMQHDFRSVYAAVLENWFGLSRSELEKVLLNDYPSLSCIKKTAASV